MKNGQQRLSIILATVNLAWSLTVCLGLHKPTLSYAVVFEISLGLVIGTALFAGLLRILIGAFCAVILVSPFLPEARHGPDATPEVLCMLFSVAGTICGAIWHDADWPSRPNRQSRRATKRRDRQKRTKVPSKRENPA